MPDQTAVNTFATRVNLCGRKFNDQRRLHDNTVFQHFTTTFRVFPVIRTVSVKPWEIDKMHNILGLHEYDELLDSYNREHEEYMAKFHVFLCFSRLMNSTHHIWQCALNRWLYMWLVMSVTALLLCATM